MVDFPSDLVPRPPQPVSYAAPLIGLQLGQQIAGLPGQYQQGFMDARTRAGMDAFKDGPPTRIDPTTGQPVVDTNEIMKKGYQLGGIEFAKPMASMIMQNQLTQDALRQRPPDQDYGGGGAPSAPGVGGTPPGGQRTPTGGYTGGDNGQNTVMSAVVGAGVPEHLAGTVALNISKALSGRDGQIDANAPVSPEIFQKAQLYAANSARQNNAAPKPPIPPTGIPAAAPPQGQPDPLRPTPVRTQSFQPPGQTPQNSQPAQMPQVAQNAQPQSPLAQGQRIPPELSMDAARNREKLARTKFYQAEILGHSNPQAAAALTKEAEGLMSSAKQIYDFHADLNKQTGPQKEYRDPVVSAGKLRYEQDKNDVTRFGKRYDSITTIGDRADEALPQIDLAKRLINSPNFYSGTGAGFVDTIKRVAVAFGLDPNKATPGEVYDKIRASSILNEIKGMAGTGPVRVQEMKFIDQMIATREYTPATLRTLIEIESRLGERAKAVRNMAFDYNNGHLDSGFDKRMSAFKNSDKGRLFTDAELRDPSLIAPPTFHNSQEAKAAGLPKGTPIKIGGEWFKVQ